MINIEIGPYKLKRRTEYSKIKIFNKEKNEDLSETADGIKISEKILSDYNKQKENEEEYFKIEGNCLKEFNKYEEIEYVFIPEGITYIDSRVFGNGFFSYIYIPDSVDVIDGLAFSSCHNLKEIKFPRDFKAFGGWSIFNNCTGLEKVDLNCEITNIPKFSFTGCNSLKEIILPGKLEEIEGYAFSGCESLEKIKIPNSVKIINECAFDKCKNLKEINIPESIKSLGLYPFMLSGIETLIFDGNINYTENPLLSFGNFLKDTNVEKIIINGNTTTYITPNLFECTNASQINTIEFIGSDKSFNKFKDLNKAFLASLYGVDIKIKKDKLENLIETEKKKVKEEIKIER